ncbi:MAG: arginine decarboxylase [Saprospiraceae bacterium]|nr:arginine decarboxylase [Saprospiraceae bacterium]MDG2418975.1 arginine decarboxylase [Saprospiraceae bacterium]
MKNTYSDLIEQTYYFPQEGFDIKDGYLYFHGVSLQYLIEEYGTPFKLSYLPKIGDQIKKAKNLFKRAMRSNSYKGDYYYCYCTKCCHFQHVISEAVKHDVHLETSSSFDIDLILKLYEQGKITTSTVLVHNGYKTEDYIHKILKINDLGFKNSITILDSMRELKRFAALDRKLKIGIRMATDLQPKSDYYTSRLGIQPSQILDFFENHISKNKNLELKMLHFFVDSGIKDNFYYWGEFQKGLKMYVELKKLCPELRSLNLGGGFPIKNTLGFDYDYKYIVNEIVRNIKETCEDEGIQEPDIFTEFGKYTVGESGAVIFEVLEHKKQNDAENWYIINNSLMNTIPDAWSVLEKFILLPINKWDKEYQRVNIGGISCDHSDYYNSDELNQQIHLPKHDNDDKEPLYLGFFHTGAYQDAISGYGGIKHCLIPSPKLVVIDRDKTGNFVSQVYREEQKPEDMLRILGY